MQKLLIKLLEMMGATAGGDVTVEGIDNYLWRIELPLGKIDGGTYEGKHWGDAVIEDTDASLYFVVGNLYDKNRFSFGEGIVELNYADSNEGLAYTGDLEDVVTARIKDLYNLNADGSEQGMQGDDYLSLDIWVDGFDNELTDEQMDADFDDEESEAVLQTFSPYATA
jgi:hypothetical protein